MNNQTTKLRVSVMPHRDRIAAWFPDDELDGKLFQGTDVPEITRYMYERRLRKQTFTLQQSGE